MIRFLLSLVVLTLLITYVIIPIMNKVLLFFKKEGQRIDKAYNNNNNKEDGRLDE